jgi:di/tricarboxylate transporter
MNSQLLLVLGILVACVAMFIIGRPRMDVVALLALVVLALTRIITVPEALAGFSDPNVILIAAFFVVGDGLVRTGTANRIGDLLLRHAGASEGRLIVLLMIAVALLGSVTSSMGVVAIFIPAVLTMSQRQNVSPHMLMMPLAFGGLISGMMTLVATAPNLVCDSALRHAGFDGFKFFTFSPFGVTILAAACAYMLTARKKLREDGQTTTSVGDRRRTLMDFVRDYKLEERAHRVRIGEGSPLIGQTLRQAAPAQRPAASILAIERMAGSKLEIVEPRGETALRSGDVLLVNYAKAVDQSAVQHLAELKVQRLSLSGSYFTDQSQDLGMAEVMLPPESDLIGRTIVEAAFRTRYRLHVVGLRRGSRAIEADVNSKPLRCGDVLLVIGRWKHIRALHKQHNSFLVLSLPAEIDQFAPARRRAPRALLIVAIMVVLMVTGWVPNVVAALLGCLLMGVCRCITAESAYKAIGWPTVILIVGMMPFSTALAKTGGVDLAANGLLHLFGQSEPRIILAALFALTASIGLFVSNTATAVLMAPIALTVARHLNVSPYPFAMTVALAASTAFMTPVSSPVNTLVMAPGKYRFGDFVKVGVPLALITMLITVLMVPWLLPLRQH